MSESMQAIHLKIGVGKTILIVDDDLDLRDVMEFDFKRIGFHVLTAGGGHEAFRMLQTDKIDIVLTDIKMPEGDGIELLKNIKSWRTDMPVICLTGYTEISATSIQDLGAIKVFEKPFDRKELRETVIRSLAANE